MIRNRTRSRFAAIVVSALAVTAGGVAASGCGDDNEGPAEEAGKAIDTAAKEVTGAAKKGAHEVDKNVDVNVTTNEDAGDDKGGKNKGSDDRQKDDKGGSGY
jgi:hypothetical protein